MTDDNIESEMYRDETYRYMETEHLDAERDSAKPILSAQGAVVNSYPCEIFISSQTYDRTARIDAQV